MKNSFHWNQGPCEAYSGGGGICKASFQVRFKNLSEVMLDIRFCSSLSAFAVKFIEVLVG